MKQKKVKLSVLLLSFGLTVKAQQATTATGGIASGSGGSATYSIGQVVFITNTSSNGSVAQGVQQAYEIYDVGIAETDYTILLQANPNPTTDYLTLNIGSSELSDLNFQLFDISGKIIEDRKIQSTIETINIEKLPSAIYYLKVSNNNNEVKTFKIIKN